MLRTSILLLILIVVYLFISLISSYDNLSILNLGYYKLEISTILLIFCVLVIILLIITASKIVSRIYEMPHIIKLWFLGNSKEKQLKIILQSMEAVITKKESFYKTCLANLADVKEAFLQDYKNTLLAILETDENHKILALKRLKDNSDLEFFAYKHLAINYFKQNELQKTEEYGLRALNLNEYDAELLMILHDLFIKASKAEKYELIVNKLQNNASNQYQKSLLKITDNYLAIAENYLRNDNQDRAIHYLRQIIKIKVNHIEAINLLVEIYLANQQTNLIINLINTAFAYKASYDLYLLAKPISYLFAENNLEIYSYFAELNIEAYKVLALIAADLKLENELNSNLQKTNQKMLLNNVSDN